MKQHLVLVNNIIFVMVASSCLKYIKNEAEAIGHGTTITSPPEFSKLDPDVYLSRCERFGNEFMKKEEEKRIERAKQAEELRIQREKKAEEQRIKNEKHNEKVRIEQAFLKTPEGKQHKSQLDGYTAVDERVRNAFKRIQQQEHLDVFNECDRKRRLEENNLLFENRKRCKLFD